MKLYDFKKATELIEKHKENLKMASLGLHEDWFWTSETIWEDGKFTKVLFIEDIEELKALQGLKDEMLLKAVHKAGYKSLAEYMCALTVSVVGSLTGQPVPKAKSVDVDIEIEDYSIGGLISSEWATPALHMIFSNGTDLMVPCYIQQGDDMDIAERIHLRMLANSGPLSSEVQKNITELEENNLDD